ncbi:uncharacterized protein LOC133844070 [Drosophila sulfurigaster albostrigata]|uniref:uncharacterized protein LOC133844070 n=1 Tax=Drosophila sulfurigaster albostrigata TaxID=89887 RepID=UPI002D218C1A|nr:uncharacterized protein LOC133844070 [Drosophila sulfurigaster albostrigata]
MLKYFLIWSSLGFLVCVAHITFTNLKCSFANETYGEIKLCRIKAVNRTHKYLSLHISLNTILDNLNGNLKLMRFDNGYKPFFIDITYDICKFLKDPQNIFVKAFYNTFKERSNMNHTCPYEHDVIVDKVWTGNLEQGFGRFLPTPNGDFALLFTLYTNNNAFAHFNLYLRKT